MRQTLIAALMVILAGCGLNDASKNLDLITNNKHDFKPEDMFAVGGPTSINGKRIMFDSGEVVMFNPFPFLGENELVIKKFSDEVVGLKLKPFICNKNRCEPTEVMSKGFKERLGVDEKDKV